MLHTVHDTTCVHAALRSVLHELSRNNVESILLMRGIGRFTAMLIPTFNADESP